MAAVLGQQAVSRSAINTPNFRASKIKLDLPPKFMGKLSELNGWVFQVEQYCNMVGVNKPTDMVKLAVSCLEGDAFTWWRQLMHRAFDFDLGMLIWSEFKFELVNAFGNMDQERRLCHRLASLKQQASVSNYTKQFYRHVLELGEYCSDISVLLFIFTEGLKSDIQMQVILARPQFLSEVEQVIERADMALLLSRKRQQQGQHPRQQSWQYRQYGQQRPPLPPPRNGPTPMDLGALQGQQSNEQQQPQFSAARQIVCYRCGKQGHMKKYCKARLRNPQQQQLQFVWVQQLPQYLPQFWFYGYQPALNRFQVQPPVLQPSNIVPQQPPQFQHPPQNYMYMGLQQQPQCSPYQAQQPPSPPLLNGHGDNY